MPDGWVAQGPPKGHNGLSVFVFSETAQKQGGGTPYELGGRQGGYLKKTSGFTRMNADEE
jgi:hypothetical protein